MKNELKHTEGVLSMARAMHPDSAGSQFFIMHKNAPHLDGAYAAFGKVTEGMEVVNQIAETDTDYSDRPLDEQKIKSMTVDTFGVDYPEPEKLSLIHISFSSLSSSPYIPSQIKRSEPDAFFKIDSVGLVSVV